MAPLFELQQTSLVVEMHSDGGEVEPPRLERARAENRPLAAAIRRLERVLNIEY